MNPPKKPLPWERQEGETDDEFKMFVYYRDMPRPRRVVSGTSSVPLNERWEVSRNRQWVSRVKEWDDHLSQLAIEAAEEEVQISAKQAAQEHLKIFASLREYLMREASKHLQQSRDMKGGPMAKLSDLTKLGEFVVKGERLVLGETTENTSTHLDLTRLSDEDLDALEKITEKAGTVGDDEVG